MGKRRTGRRRGDTCFLLMVRSWEGVDLAGVAIEGLRTFGGPLRDSPVWVFVPGADQVSHILPDLGGVRRLPLAVGEDSPPYPFDHKVSALARAEELAGPEVRSLVWISLDALIVSPPVLLDLGPSPEAGAADAAFRPVHHQNVGSPAGEPLDGFWQGVYRAVGVEDTEHTVESFVDRKTLRPYFNTHCFALDPALGLGRAWRDRFRALVTDESFQAGPCSDALHQLFLHQAVLSALVVKQLAWSRLRLLPPDYGYPLLMLEEIPADDRPGPLNDLVIAVYEDTAPWGEVEIREPLLSWLRARLPS